MTKRRFFSRQSALYLTLLLVTSLALAACDEALNRIGERPDPTTSPVSQRTATPGGRISVWMVSPTGPPVAGDNPVADGTPRGEVVGPAATATALVGTLTAATQTAAAPPNPPSFQTDDCPEPSGRVPEPRPDIFEQFPAAIGTYLSEGGPTSVLESELRNWGAITRQGGIVQADTDLTGDGSHEIIVTLYNPFTYNPDAPLNAGQLLVYGCDNGGYRLLYSTRFSPGLALPILHRVGDMNADVKAEVVYSVKSCTYTYCIDEGQILTWNTITGSFEPLNNSPIVTINGRLGIGDVDGDGILEIEAVSNPPSSVPGEEAFRIRDIWDWTGRNYVLALRES